MEQILEFSEIYGKLIIVAASALTIITILLAILFKPFSLVSKKRKAARTDTGVAHTIISTPSEPVVTMTLAEFEVKLEAKAKLAQEELLHAQDGDRSRLEAQLVEVERQKSNPEKALKEAESRISDLEHALARIGNAAEGDELRNALNALKSGNTTLADVLFEKVEGNEALAVESAARAAFARGEIAEGDIRWADAAFHYTRAARLAPDLDRLFKAWEFTWRMGDNVAARFLGEELVAVARKSGDQGHIAAALNELAITLRSLGNYDEAEKLHRQALSIRQDAFGQNDPICVESLSNLAAVLRDTGNYDEAETLFRSALQICDKAAGKANADYAAVQSNLAQLLTAMGRMDEAEPILVASLTTRQKVLGADHPDTALSLYNLGKIYQKMKRFDEALPLMEMALSIRTSRLGPGHSKTTETQKAFDDIRAAI